MADSFLITDPGALRFLLIIPVLLLLHMMRSRYRRRKVSSTMLWRSVRRDLEARQRLRLPPLSLLLLLQLLAVGAGTAALAKVALPARDLGHLVVLLDVSSSMQATDVAPSRFAQAVAEARQAIQQMKPGDRLSLVAVGPSPTLVASGTEATAVLAALDHVSPGAATADAAAALRLAESLVEETGGHGRALLLSAGVFGPSFRAPEVAVPVEYRAIGLGGENQGITEVDVRADLDNSGRWSAFARVANFADHEAEVSATATADDLPLDTRQLKLAPRGSSELSFALPPGTRSFALTLDTGDALAIDRRVEVEVDTPRPRSVLLVSRDPGAIEKVLQTLPGLKLSAVKPESYQGAAGSDLVVLDNFVPATLPDTDLLIMNPPIDAPGLSTKAAGNEAPVLRSQRGSNLIASVDLQSLRLGQMVRLETPEWAHAIVDGPAGPLILEGDRAGRKVVIFNFDWTLFDLPRMQAFPLLLFNAVAELDPTALPRALQPGETVLIRPVADATEASVELPDGSVRLIPLAQGARGFGDTEQVGRYTVRWKGRDLGEVDNGFNVNVASETQSDIAPRQHSFGQGVPTRGLTAPVAGQQLWPILALLLLGLLAVEWAYYTRRS